MPTSVSLGLHQGKIESLLPRYLGKEHEQDADALRVFTYSDKGVGH